LCHPKLEVNQHLTTSSKLDYLELDQNWVWFPKPKLELDFFFKN
jgi:hypothetical protein